MKIGDDVDLNKIAEDTDLFTGAELEGLCREAGIVALRENISATVVCNRHFQTVKESLKPALTPADIEKYSSFMKTQMTSSWIESNANHGIKRRYNLFGTLLAVKIGVLSFVFLAAAKYLMYTNMTKHNASAT